MSTVSSPFPCLLSAIHELLRLGVGARASVRRRHVSKLEAQQVGMAPWNFRPPQRARLTAVSKELLGRGLQRRAQRNARATRAVVPGDVGQLRVGLVARFAVALFAVPALIAPALEPEGALWPCSVHYLQELARHRHATRALACAARL